MNMWRGLYFCFLDGEREMHYFHLYITNSTIQLVQTYGGVKSVTRKTFPRKKWLRNFVKAMSGDKDAYAYVFNLSEGSKNVMNHILYRKVKVN
jgi:hypothetical protein